MTERTAFLPYLLKGEGEDIMRKDRILSAALALLLAVGACMPQASS